MPIATLDLVLLVLYVASTVAFGLWMGRGQRSAQDYLLGGRDLPWGVLLLSIVATETSTVTFLSLPGVAYFGDLRFLQLPLGYIVGRAIAATVMVPQYFRGELFTAYDVLRVRSGPHVRTLASAIFLVTRTVADGLRLFLTAIVLQVMFGWELSGAVIAVGAATVVYTVIGGIKAVVWTDAIQFFVYMAGAAIAFFVMHDKLDGGLGAALSGEGAAERLRVFALEWDLAESYTLWAGLIGGAVLSIGSHGVDQLIVQRFLCARSQRDAQRALFWSGPVVLGQFAIFLLLGVGLAGFYAQFPPQTPFAKSDRVFADFIVNQLPTGVVGVVLGALFSAAMSTLSSSLSASASALVNDFVLPMTRHARDSRFALRAAKAATVLFATLQILVGVTGLGLDPDEPVIGQVLAIQNLNLGMLLGLFALALGKRRSAKASLVGLLGGLAMTLWIVFFKPSVGWPWLGVMTCSATVLVGRAALVITGPRDLTPAR